MEYANFIKATYRGPTNTTGSRWHLSWQGWPSEGGRNVSRFLPYDYAGRQGAENIAQRAADAFCDWLSNDMPGGGKRRTIKPERVIAGSMGPDSYAIMVSTKVDP